MPLRRGTLSRMRRGGWRPALLTLLAAASSGLSCSAVVECKVRQLARDNPHVLYRVETQAKAVALTIDDGPAAATTPEILRVLERNRAHATFFIISSRVRGNEDLLVKTLSNVLPELARRGFRIVTLTELESLM